MKTLDARALNRARLDRQWLTRPRDEDALTAMEHLVGLQAQAGDPPYFQLWSRLTNFTTDELSAALDGRRAVRLALMRGTIHLVTARDCLALRPVMQPQLDKTLFNGSESGKRLVGLDAAELVAEGQRLLAEGPLPVEELGAALAKRFGDFDAADLAYVLRCAAPLIQTPPRGVWGRGGGLTYASCGQWLDAEPGTDASPDAVILRYLAAYGPASVQDFQTWSSLTGTNSAFARLRARLVCHRDAEGVELFDLPGVDLPDPDQPLPPLLVGGFDNILLAHRDRRFVLSSEAQKRVFTQNGLVKPTILLDGFVAGTWRPTVKKRSAHLDLEPFEELTAAQREHLEYLGRRLLEFAAPLAETRTIAFA